MSLTEETLLFALGEPHSIIVRCAENGDDFAVISRSTEWDDLETQGWQVDRHNRYVSQAQHFCPRHRVQFWVTWCADPDCGSCTSNDEKIVRAPETLDHESVMSLIENQTCKNMNRICDAEPTEEPQSFHINFSPDIVLDFPTQRAQQRERLF